MATNFDKWTFLKLLEVIATVVCLAFKRVTDLEASRLFLYLQKLSREWRLLNNVTWNGFGAALADATYGGYVIITAALFVGRLMGELPTEKRIIEYILLGVGALLFIILGSLELSSLDSVPDDLVDNGIIIACITFLTAAFFLLDMGGPRARRAARPVLLPRLEPKTATQQVLDIERELARTELKPTTNFHRMKGAVNGVSKAHRATPPAHASAFGIYGRDVPEGPQRGDAPAAEEHSPVWSKIRKGHYGNYDFVSSTLAHVGDDGGQRAPSSPSDPGYVQYTARHWGEQRPKTPRASPTQV